MFKMRAHILKSVVVLFATFACGSSSNARAESFGIKFLGSSINCQATIAGEGYHLPTGKCALNADGLGYGVGHGTVIKRAKQTALTIHG